ncbi:MAG TPA: hypothetical protein VGO06_24330 [Bosea sp. (in: a-proteobacteria)]|uniref:hypothetical protein n=1 Tax=Bosea sp. (in: a-proteobacteria) TaxID=1871050 RepID=UPI002E11E3F9|nr:hypothetical protein [Bosea sp. (in: a-proteobacteria)]
MKSLIAWWCSLSGPKDKVLIDLATAIMAVGTPLWAISTVLSLVAGVLFTWTIWR